RRPHRGRLCPHPRHGCPRPLRVARVSAQIITVGMAESGGAEEAAALAVAHALRAEGIAVAARVVVEEDETALEAVLAPALRQAGLVGGVGAPGGSGGRGGL